MSGVGEALAIVSCVAGLIQAYDAGSRVVKQIKARRQNHDALPPSDLLEESIEKGKREIEQVVAEGNERFGSSFEEGDATAQLALYKITIATQNALLAGLTQARDDDGVIDFDTCIDTSDKGRVDALIALHALFQRKLDEEIERKKNLSSQQAPPLQQPHPLAPPSLQKTEAQPATITKAEQTPPPTPELPKVKKSRTFTNIVLRRKENGQNSATSTQMDNISPTNKPELSPMTSEQGAAPRSSRRNTGTSVSSTGTWSSAESRSSTVRSNTTSPSIAPISRQSTALSTMSSMSAMSTLSAVSGMSNLSTASTLAPITRYQGTCKYAYDLRDGQIKNAFRLAPVGMHGKTYKCASSKCHFTVSAAHKGDRIEDRVMKTTSGLQYRFLFLAKSHKQQPDPQPPSLYRCLVCMMQGNNSGVYHGNNVLLSHLETHQGTYLDQTLLEGPLIFTNNGAKPGTENEFDIKFPEVEKVPRPAELPSDHGAAVVVASRVPTGSQSAGDVILSKAATTTYGYEYENPWAA
ncbi:uncharacterized protein Z518_07278 [Rhinocladiella mackenziei CBS 650.93]|uniref:Uncharacterized protein n=1 Tax=Rhinocladiella mackenziei CBS 650.93 TaxID=1442369 RepID=A0A0D2J400_9EURO|nr:uncharacterized protein Z518_07278 [Rhinocladiella mackenziei CBS 650.93]KIX03725.1 hypothetical protein Z518_07278 [Rhinocladiella mackenziei CBS 650.93]